MGEKYELEFEEEINMASNFNDLEGLELLQEDAPRCSECPWNRHCLNLPKVTEEEAKEFLQDNLPTGDKMQDAILVKWAKERLNSLPACPRFMERVKNDGEFVRSIKKVMRGEAEIVEKGEEDE